MKSPTLLLGACIIALATPANAAITFHSNIADWRSGAAGGQSSHAPAAERLETFDDAVTATVVGGHNAVATGAPYTDIGFSLAMTAANTFDSTGAGAFRTGAAGRGIRFRAGVGTDSAVFTIPGSGASAFAVNIHDMFDTVNTGMYQLEIFVNGALSFDTGVVAGIGGNLQGTVPYQGLVAGTMTPFPAIAVGQNGGAIPTGTFIGFTASPSSAITSVELRKTTTVSAGDNWGFDHVLIVPEPSRALLLLLGSLPFLLRRRR